MHTPAAAAATGAASCTGAALLFRVDTRRSTGLRDFQQDPTRSADGKQTGRPRPKVMREGKNFAPRLDEPDRNLKF